MTRTPKLFGCFQRAFVVLCICLVFSISAGENDVIFDDSFETFTGEASLSLAGDAPSTGLSDNLG